MFLILTRLYRVGQLLPGALAHPAVTQTHIHRHTYKYTHSQVHKHTHSFTPYSASFLSQGSRDLSHELHSQPCPEHGLVYFYSPDRCLFPKEQPGLAGDSGSK